MEGGKRRRSEDHSSESDPRWRRDEVVRDEEVEEFFAIVRRMREDSRCFPVGIAGGGLAWDSPIGAAKGEIMWRPVFEPEDFDQTDAVGGGGAKGAPAIGRIGGGDGGCGEAERISGGFDLNAPLEAEGTVSAGCSDGEARVRVFGRDGGKY